MSFGLIVAIAVLFVVASAVVKFEKASKSGRKATGEVQAVKPLTDNEQGMYFRLTTAFPDHVVLAQVSFQALLDTKDTPTRHTFDRKRADFVLCNKAFDVLAIVELDDSSHRGRAAADAKRDSVLERAGYKVLHYRGVPDVARLRADIGHTGTLRAGQAAG